MAIGTAIHVAETEGLDLGREKCPHLSDGEYNQRRQVWNGTIFMSVQVVSMIPTFLLIGRRWIAIVTGRSPQINPYTTRDPFIQVFRDHLEDRTSADIP
jgi:hypothetical protein